jgi:hypothetical protein
VVKAVVTQQALLAIRIRAGCNSVPKNVVSCHK